MRGLAIVLLLASCATAGPLNAPTNPPPTVAAVDAAGNRLEPLVTRAGQSCTADHAWCVADNGAITFPDHVQRVAVANLEDSEQIHAWPFIIRRASAQGALVGLTSRRTDMYSGASASETWLTLYSVSPSEDKATPVASMMLEGSASIRACFSEQDRQARRSACADRYDFTGAPNLITDNTDQWPRLSFSSEAWTFPGRVSRNQSSTEGPPLQARDLVWVRDAACSHQRIFAYAEGRYAPDAPAPECADYRRQ